MSITDININNKSGKPLLQIVNEYLLLYANQPGDKMKLRLTQLALNAYRNLNLTVLSEVNIKVVYLPVTAALTIEMPNDYVSYAKVAVPVGNEYWTLTVNTDLLPPKRANDDCGLPFDTAIQGGSDGISNGWYYTPHYNKNGEFIGKFYGVGGGFNSRGYFKEDFPNRRFILSGVTASEIVLEYKSSGVDQNVVVPQYAIEAVLAYIRWHMELGRYPMDKVAARLQEKLYAAQMEFIVDYTNPFIIEEYFDAHYKDVHLSVKR